MKKLLFTLLFFGLCFSTQANNDPKVGDELFIKAPVAQTYNHIKFPKPNILIKKARKQNYRVVGDKILFKFLK